jgi:hypothetical protein
VLTCLAMDFSAALLLIKSGLCVRRRGWNATNQYLALTGPHTRGGMTRDFIWIRTAQHECAPWLASQGDLMAEDWEQLSGEDLAKV